MQILIVNTFVQDYIFSDFVSYDSHFPFLIVGHAVQWPPMAMISFSSRSFPLIPNIVIPKIQASMIPFQKVPTYL